MPEHERALPNPEPGPETRELMHITLVDADTGVIRVLRVASLSPEFSAKLNDAIRAQAARPFDQRDHDAAIADAYARYPHNNDMVGAADIRCTGGD